MTTNGDYGADVDRAGYKYFDWNQAADLIKAQAPRHAFAKLKGDVGVEGTQIWKDGAIFVPTGVRVNLCSEWADPVIEMISFAGGRYTTECYRLSVPGTQLGGYWPASARARLV